MRRFVAGLVLAATIASPPVDAQDTRSFGDGTHLVGTDIAPGLYGARAPAGCYWERLSGLSGELDDVITNDMTGQAGTIYVEIQPTDVAFTSHDCGTWYASAGAATQPTTTGSTSYEDFLAGVLVMMEDLSEVPSGAGAFGRWADAHADDWLSFLVTVRPDPCYIGLYAEVWRLYGTMTTLKGITMMPPSARRSFGDVVEFVLAPDVTGAALADASGCS